MRHSHSTDGTPQPPNPGSFAARLMGCTCPARRARRNPASTHWEFATDGACPMHGAGSGYLWGKRDSDVELTAARAGTTDNEKGTR